jgi:hypothetical protein
MYHGEPYYVCENCGLTVKKKNNNTGRNPKYCPACAVEIHVQQTINAVMKRRYPHRNQELSYKKYTVYLHKFPDGKIYVGMTSQSLSQRWRRGAGYANSPVGAAINKFGWDNVKHYILFSGLDRESAKYIESYYIKTRHAYLPEYGYNIHNTSYSKVSDNVTPEFVFIEVDGAGRTI